MPGMMILPDTVSSKSVSPVAPAESARAKPPGPRAAIVAFSAINRYLRGQFGVAVLPLLKQRHAGGVGGDAVAQLARVRISGVHRATH